MKNLMIISQINVNLKHNQNATFTCLSSWTQEMSLSLFQKSCSGKEHVIQHYNDIEKTVQSRHIILVKGEKKQERNIVYLLSLDLCTLEF